MPVTVMFFMHRVFVTERQYPTELKYQQAAAKSATRDGTRGATRRSDQTPDEDSIIEVAELSTTVADEISIAAAKTAEDAAGEIVEGKFATMDEAKAAYRERRLARVKL